jgi:hypothetical protein
LITGAALTFVGLFLGIWGSVRFDFGTMASGWILAGVGAVVFFASLVTPP